MHEARYRDAEAALFAHAGVAPDEHWVDLRSLGTTARVLEVGSGPPAVFLHGGPMAAATWAYVAASAPELRCLLVDRPGTGLSPAPPAIPDVRRLPDYVEALTRDVLDGFALERAALVGSSFGGYSVLRSALALGERIGRIVLAGYPAFVPCWTQPSFFTLLRTPLVGRLVLAAPATRTSVRLSLRQLGHGHSLATGRIPEPMIAWTRAWQRHTDTMRNDGRMIIGLGSWRGGFDASLDLTAGDLAAVRSPCLVLVGTDDPVGAAPEAHHLGGLLSSARVELLEHAGHLPWLDDAELVAARISDWVHEGQTEPEQRGGASRARSGPIPLDAR